jgi:hypothetical protein
MDEVSLVTQLRPAPPPDPDEFCQAARARLSAAYHDRTPQWRRPGALALGTAALTGVAVAAIAITGPASPSHPAAGHHLVKIETAAWSVRANRDLTVTITVRQTRDPAGLQRALRQEGVPAVVSFSPAVTVTVNGQQITGPACEYVGSQLAGADVSQAVIVPGSVDGSTPAWGAVPVTPSGVLQASLVFTIRPSALPSGDVILIEAFEAQSGPPATGIGLSVLSRVGKCVPLAEWLKEKPGPASKRS